MDVSIIARRYAKALRILVGSDDLLQIQTEFKSIIILLDNKSILSNVMQNPAFSIDERKKIIDLLFINKKIITNKKFIDFLYFLIKKDKFIYLKEIFNVYVKDLNKYLNNIKIKIISPSQLNKKFSETLLKSLKLILKKNIIVDFEIEKSILGGIRMEIDGYIFDDTIKNKLILLEKKLISASI